MISSTPPDPRSELWSTIEKSIQDRAPKKDSSFNLSGPWKIFQEERDGFKVFAVDGEWVRNNLSIIFGHGGHGLVHEFIPHDEIWIATHHPFDCECRKVQEDRAMSPRAFLSTTLHEIKEYIEMKSGLPYWPAHNLALEEERNLGILKDPYEEDYRGLPISL